MNVSTPKPTPYGEAWVCTDCYFAHHYGVTTVDREATDDESHDWHGGYLRDGHSLPNIVEETDHGLTVREWFAGDSDTPCDRQPLARLDGFDTADNTDGETGDGIHEFSWSSCDGCGSTLGGSRYRLSLWERS